MKFTVASLSLLLAGSASAWSGMTMKTGTCVEADSRKVGARSERIGSLVILLLLLLVGALLQ